jgi:hypothetical protein
MLHIFTFIKNKLNKQPLLSNNWPTVQDIGITAFLAIILTALEIYFSSQIGLLSYPPGQDGITYMGLTKDIFYRSRLNTGWLWFQQPAPILSLVTQVSNAFIPTPLWYLLILLSFLVFGEGEWQCYTVRFWPTFLLLLLMLWVIRRRGNSTIAWLCVAFTALLPTISVSLRSSIRDYFTGQVDFASNFASRGYLADLRPDLLFTVLLLWAIVPLVEHSHNLTRRSLLVSGTFAGLAILCKASASPLLLFAWGLTFLYVFVINSRKFRATVLICLWAILPFGLLLNPFILAGGAKRMFDYLFSALTAGRVLYVNPNATFLSEATFYWLHFPSHIGQFESWLILGAGFLSFLLAWVKLKRTDSKLLAYLCLSVALYIVPSITPNKNFFVGLSYYLLLWLFSWAALTPILLWVSHNRFKAGLLTLAALYTATTIFGGFYSLQIFPVGYKQAGLNNRHKLQQVSNYLQSTLTTDDCFVLPDYFQYSSYIYYKMINSKTMNYRPVIWDASSPPNTLTSFVRNEVSKCKVILVYQEDMEKVSKYLPYAPPITWPFFRTVAEKVSQPNSIYQLAQEYKLTFYPLTMEKNQIQNINLQIFLKRK